jgi:hypothetical protein
MRSRLLRGRTERASGADAAAGEPALGDSAAPPRGGDARVSVALLRGGDHEGVGEIAAIAEGAVAVALSRGGCAKQYPHRHPNEDAAGFARGGSGVLLAVADAHAGREASELAVQALLARCGAAWTGAGAPAWPEAAREALAGVHAEVVAASVRAGNETTRTTLAFALVRPEDDLLAWASLGDSHVFRAGAGGVEELAAGREDPSWFVGSAARAPEDLAARLRAGHGPLAAARAVVLVTDGLSEQGIGVDDPAAAVGEALAAAAAEAPDLRALCCARALLTRAFEAHRRHGGGDNLGAAVWLRDA